MDWEKAIAENIDWFPFDTDITIIRKPTNTPAIMEGRTRNNRIIQGIFTNKGRLFLWANQFRQLVKIMEGTEGNVQVRKVKQENFTVIVKVPTLDDATLSPEQVENLMIKEQPANESTKEKAAKT